MNMVSHKSTFPVDIGVKITGVDSNTFSLTGESYAAVLPAESKSETTRKLQSDDVALGAYMSYCFLLLCIEYPLLPNLSLCRFVRFVCAQPTSSPAR